MSESSSPAQPALLADQSHSDWLPPALTSAAWPARSIARPCSRVWESDRSWATSRTRLSWHRKPARQMPSSTPPMPTTARRLTRFIQALAGTGKALIHTSGSSVVADEAGGEPGDAVYTDIPEHPVSGKAARVAIDRRVLAASADNIRSIVVCPTMIYGMGRGPTTQSQQIPALLRHARDTRDLAPRRPWTEPLVARPHRRCRGAVPAGASESGARLVLLCRERRSDAARDRARYRPSPRCLRSGIAQRRCGLACVGARGGPVRLRLQQPRPRGPCEAGPRLVSQEQLDFP